MTPRENLINFFSGKTYEWEPTSLDVLEFSPSEIGGNMARGMVREQAKHAPSEFGGVDWFGTEWVYEPEAHGSMDISHQLDIDDIDNWRDYVTIPDVDAIDWKAIYEKNKDFLATDRMINSTITSGYFERLIAFMNFEDASVAIIDEDCEDAVKDMFRVLTDVYIKTAKHLHEDCGVGMFTIHDDWGGQYAQLISPATHKKMIYPYIVQFVDAVHAMGCFVEQHSCGYMKDILPALIASGVDTWRGQEATSKLEMAKEHPEFKFSVRVGVPADHNPETLVAALMKTKEPYGDLAEWWALPPMRYSPEEKAAVREALKKAHAKA